MRRMHKTIAASGSYNSYQSQMLNRFSRMHWSGVTWEGDVWVQAIYTGAGFGNRWSKCWAENQLGSRCWDESRVRSIVFAS